MKYSAFYVDVEEAKAVFALIMALFSFTECNGMFLIPTHDPSSRMSDEYVRQVSDNEEEECLSAYEKGINGDLSELKHAIVGRDKIYSQLVENGINNAVQGNFVDFKRIYCCAVIKDLFATLGYRLESLHQYPEAYFWLKVASVGNSNYSQDAERIKKELNNEI